MLVFGLDVINIIFKSNFTELCRKAKDILPKVVLFCRIWLGDHKTGILNSPFRVNCKCKWSPQKDYAPKYTFCYIYNISSRVMQFSIGGETMKSWVNVHCWQGHGQVTDPGASDPLTWMTKSSQVRFRDMAKPSSSPRPSAEKRLAFH